LNLPDWLTAERHQAGDSLVHRLDARVKIVGTVAFAFAITLVPEGRWSAYAALAVLVALMAALSRLSPGFLARRSGLALPFVGAALPLVFTRSGELAFSVPVMGWTASEQGLVAVASIMLKSMLAVLTASVLVGSTRPADLIRALERLRLPRILSSTIMLMYRYIFVIADEGQRMLRARDSRSASLLGGASGGSIAWRAGVTGRMVGTLFLRSYERGERVHAAMRARGYDGSLRARAGDEALRVVDWAAMGLMLSSLAGIVAYARL
jgi:cobalt/nickel transport system permease protein